MISPLTTSAARPPQLPFSAGPVAPSQPAATDTASSVGTPADTLSALIAKLLPLLSAPASATQAQQGAGSIVRADTEQIHSQQSPNLQIPGGDKYSKPVQTAFAALSQQASGRQLLKGLAGRDITVAFIDNATYTKLAKKGTDQPHVLTLPLSALTDPKEMATALVSGLAVELQGMNAATS